MVASIDISGKKFARWTVLSFHGSVNKKRMWNCICECGTEMKVNGTSLRMGVSKSCGCLSADNVRTRLTKHGMTKHPLFGVWKGMLSRCNNPHAKSFPDYGGRGIKVCDRWLDFKAFHDDMIDAYGPGMTIERKDNEEGYSPGNCTWIPKAEQNRNRRSVIFIDTPVGRLSISDAARVAGVSWFAISNRVKKGWSIETILSPARGK
jgi:hypothetical protein